MANKITEIGIQIHGGMGFIEETGAAQFYRDARVTSIYEGTNGIQAMDLVGRKMNDGGEAAQGLISEIKSTENLAINFSIEQKELLTCARIKLQEATNWMLNCESISERYAGSSPFLFATWPRGPVSAQNGPPGLPFREGEMRPAAPEKSGED